MALFWVLVVTTLLIGIELPFSMAHGVLHAPPLHHPGVADGHTGIAVGKCHDLSDCLCPKRCKTRDCTTGQCYCRDGGGDILAGNCRGDKDCVCPKRFKSKFCVLGDCYCYEC
ncbi:hypothetical protein CASFOL_035705 [Castilleja foliolosa]|uniref:Uncharacterized protein n=1 Tax=Castilleja foliolosa TaxID=1961234 RepID=A0ABD3BU87_9LAMI